MLSNGQSYAIQILVARDLNLNPSFVDKAEKYLKTNVIEPFLIGRFSNEASNCVKLINQNNLINKAKELVNNYC
jgi:hypothetical protein